jgi:hypothetical protein
MSRIIYLSHRITPDLPEQKARLRKISAGLQHCMPGVTVRYPHDLLPEDYSRLIEDDPRGQGFSMVCLRKNLLIGGQSPAASSPFGGGRSGRVAALRPADEVMVVSETCSDIAIDQDIAAGYQVPVTVTTIEQQSRWIDIAMTHYEDGDSSRPRSGFRSVGEVIRTYHQGMEQVIGVQGIDYRRSKGDGNAHGVKERIEVTTSKIAAACHVVELAGLRDWQMAMLVHRYVDGMNQDKLARLFGVRNAWMADMLRKTREKVEKAMEQVTCDNM